MNISKDQHSELEKRWKSAKSSSGDFEPVQNGRHTARLVDGVLGTSRNGRLQVVLTFKIHGGEDSGRVLKSFEGVETEQNIMFFKRLLGRLGFDEIEELEDLESVLIEIPSSEVFCAIEVKTEEGGFTSVRVKNRLTDVDDDNDEEEEAPWDEDDGEDAKSEEGDDEDVEDSESDEDGFETFDDEDDSPNSEGSEVRVFEIGMLGEFIDDEGESNVGKIVSVDKDEETCKVKVGRKSIELDIDEVSIVEEEKIKD